MDDRSLIEAFVVHLRGNGHPDLQVDQWPEDINRASPDIEAIAGPFAIEHTSIDTLPAQRRNSAWFMEAVGRLEDEIRSLPFRLNITLKYDAVRSGQNWKSVREALKVWITAQSPALSDAAHVVKDVPGVPFELHVRKTSTDSPGLFFARFAPTDSSFSARVKQQLDRKIAKLAPYQAAGKATVLLVESEDIALMNHVLMLEAIQSSYSAGLPTGVDQLWYADTSLPSNIHFVEFTADLKRPVS